MAERYSFLAAVQYSAGLYSTVHRWLYCTPPMVAAVGKPGTLQSQFDKAYTLNISGYTRSIHSNSGIKRSWS